MCTGWEQFTAYTKGMGYFCDQEVVREELASASLARMSQANFANQTGGSKDYAKTEHNRNRSARRALENLAKRPLCGRNPRSVLRVATASYKGAHFAVFPWRLIEPLIKVSVPRWTCPVCGAPWAPMIERVGSSSHDKLKALGPTAGKRHKGGLNTGQSLDYAGAHGNNMRQLMVLGYRSTCDHPHTQDKAVPGIVLDPFGGSGTTGMVAERLSRRWVVMDISWPYLEEQARVRIREGK